MRSLILVCVVVIMAVAANAQDAGQKRAAARKAPRQRQAQAPVNVHRPAQAVAETQHAVAPNKPRAALILRPGVTTTTKSTTTTKAPRQDHKQHQSKATTSGDAQITTSGFVPTTTSPLTTGNANQMTTSDGLQEMTGFVYPMPTSAGSQTTMSPGSHGLCTAMYYEECSPVHCCADNLACSYAGPSRYLCFPPL